MAVDINQVVLVGRLTKDAELRYTPSGTAIGAISIAVNRRVKKGEEWQDEVSYFDLSLWGKQAENLQKYLLKGTQVAVDGELRQDRWEKDGQKHSKVLISVNNLQLLGSGRGAGAGPSAPVEPSRTPVSPRGQESRPTAEFDPQSYEDDIPF